MNSVLLFVSLIAGTFSTTAADKLEQRAAGSAPEDKVHEIDIENRSINPLPVRNSAAPAPRTGRSYFVLDAGTLSDLEPSAGLDSKVQIASITKLMTAVVALEKLDPELVITIPALSLLPDESRMGLVKGERIKVKELLRGALIPSGSDAARTLASAIEGGENAFISAMNSKANDIGMKNSRFANPVGLDDDNNYSTPRDLAVLTRYALRKDLIRESVGARSYIARSEDGRTHRMSNTNQLLDGRTVFGVKTGRTDKAGECLITLSKVNGHDVITVLLGSNDRFGETAVLLSSLRSSYIWER